ncbi:molybdopterin-guanine dinucleotide biosynthesis protein B [Pontibacillus salicampi]|uniref:Molybdopterin-guanine dinucleotide biosynthesis protein B n=1 Tax=Pontibacillus salicampi TaxID=1449801 RepID=A0ABV6LQV5_9BACI
MGSRFPFFVFQIVGYKHSGKTTLMEKIIKALEKEGLRVGTFKHHGHGGFPDIMENQNDSEKHRLAGAVVSGVEGEGLLQLVGKQSTWSLDEVLSAYESFHLDVVLVEGCKAATFPKCVLLRGREDMDLLDLPAVEVVITKETIKESWSVPCFRREEEEQYIPWLIRHVKERRS